MTEADIIAALARKYAAPEWAFMVQVGNGTGYAGNRWADAMAMSLWPSRGLTLHGFEVKVSRGDWLRELMNPKKAEDVAGFCDYWSIVVPHPHEDTIKAGELPGPWGLYVVDGRGVRQVKAPVLRPDRAELTRQVFAALMRRATEGMVPKSTIQARVDDAYKRGLEVGRLDSDGERVRTERSLESLRATVEKFERESGVKLHTWDCGDIGAVVKVALALRRDGLDSHLREAEARAVLVLENIRAARAESSRVVTVPVQG